MGGSNGSGKFTAVAASIPASPLTKFTVLGLSGMPVPQSQSQPPKTSAQQINDLFTSSQASTPRQTASPAPPAFAQPPARSPDPFAALTSTPRQGSPFQYQQSVKQPPPASATVDLLGGAVPAPSSSLAQSSTSAANDDDEWTFASSVPDTSKEITVTNSSINVLFNVSRENDTVLLINSRISNNTPLPIANLTLQIAASKVRIQQACATKRSNCGHRARNCNCSLSLVSTSLPIRNTVSRRQSGSTMFRKDQGRQSR